MKFFSKKLLLFSLFFLSFICESYASHIVGGDITVQSKGGNQFEVTLNFFRDCSSSAAFDNSIQVGLFNKSTNATTATITITSPVITKVKLGDACYDPKMCMEKAVYTKTVTIANNTAGYYLSYHRCCRNAVITNMVDPQYAGFIMYCEIPNPSLSNSNPTFNSVPDGYMCINYPNSDDFSCTDADGDSLVYSFVTPLSCSAPVNKICDTLTINPNPFGPSKGWANPGVWPKPYGDITWASGFGLANQMGDPGMSINPKTGMVVTTPPLNGVYVFCVRVEEYRNKIKIGEIRRDFQFTTLPCWILYANFNPSPSICAGQIATLTAMGPPSGFSYSWSPGGQTTSSIVVSHTATGSYGYTVTATKDSCSSKASAFVTVNSNPVQSIITPNNILCHGNNNGSAVINPSGGIAPYTFNWALTPIQTTSIINNLTPGTYSATITDANGCSSTKTVTITQPVASLAISGISSNNVLCYGNNTGSATVSPTGGTPPYTYLWTPTQQITSNATGLTSNTYTVKVTDANNCNASSIINITQPGSALSISTSASGFSCAGTSPNGSVSSSVTGGTTPYSYLWIPGNKTSTSMNNLTAGTYSLTVTDANGCKSLSATTINSSTKPDAKFTYVPSVSCDGLVVNFKDESTPSNISSWTWNFGDGTTDYIQNPAHVFPYSSGSYPVVLVVSLPPCKDTMKYDVPVGDLFIYTTFDENTNVFTPNNDKVNDCFIPSLKGNGADKLKDCVSIEVYDRWGIKMFESNGKDNCWNGNNIQNNKPAVDGVYFYIAKLATKTIKGSITLIRNKP